MAGFDAGAGGEEEEDMALGIGGRKARRSCLTVAVTLSSNNTEGHEEEDESPVSPVRAELKEKEEQENAEAKAGRRRRRSRAGMRRAKAAGMAQILRRARKVR